ncbi:MAG: cereblon family protein [Alphaproteobacteria bacterium]
MAETDLKEKPKTGTERKKDDTLFCAACGAPVTRERFAVSERGDHEHTVFNPAGRLFTIRCFSDAPGAVTVGRPTMEFTWFPGCAWQLAACDACAAHLGWFYSGAARFFGLIKKAIKPSPS